MIYCGKCGRKLILSTHTYNTKDKKEIVKSIYRCAKVSVNPYECPKYNYIYYDDIKGRIWESVRRILNLMQSDETVLEAVRKRIAGQNNSEKLKAERSKVEKRVSALTVIVRKLYEDYAAQRLDEDGYRGLLEGYQVEKRTLTERLTAIAVELGKTGTREESISKLKLLASAYADCTELNSEIVRKLIERIEITPPNIVNGKETREINIIYRFINTTI